MAEKEEIIKNYIKAYNSFDTEGMIKDLHKDVYFKNSAGGEVNLEIIGLEAFKVQTELAKSFFTERKQTIKQLVIQGDKGEVSIDYEGKLAIDLPNGLKIGDWLRLEGKSIFYFVGNQIIGIEDIS